ncbi:MAG: inositol monophosphatase family protein [Polyangiaceae bacterium]
MTIGLAEVTELSRVALTVANEAAAVLVSGYRSRPRADEKGRADLVTEFDRRSEDQIKTRLRALTPEIQVIGEESAGSARPQGLVWYADPLDGTTNFVHGHPFFAVAIGLMYDDEPVAGAVVAPMIGARWRGFRLPSGGGEAYRNDEPCHVSPVTALSSSLIGTGFPGNREASPDNNFGSFVDVKRAAQAVRRCGAAAIDLCFVADGTYEGFWERRLQTWDVCASSAMILAAGGKVTALDGTPVRYHAGHICASNGPIHEALIAAIARGEKRKLP